MAIEHCSLVASLNLVVSDFIVPVLLEIANQDPSVILVFILQMFTGPRDGTHGLKVTAERMKNVGTFWGEPC